MRYANYEGADSREPVLSGPRRVSNALVFTVAERETAVKAAEAFFEGGPAPAGVLTEVFEYVRASGERASLSPLYPERAGRTWGGPGLEMAVSPENAAPRSRSGTHHLRVASAADRAEWERKLKKAGMRGVYRPVVQYPLDFVPLSAPPSPGAVGTVQWALPKCRFPDVWDALDAAAATDRIAVIDQGGGSGHPDLAGRFFPGALPARTIAPSPSIHAGAVMGVLSADRTNTTGIMGCCSAKIDLYNVWTTDEGFDSAAFFEALRQVSASGARVLNLSLGSTLPDPVVRDRIAECVAKGVIVVAAMGNRAESGNPRIFPAAFPGVIAVGATTRFDRRPVWSSTGPHIHIAAPGEDIRTVFGDSDERNQNGTSFAAPMVAAAVWLILRARPCWGLQEVRDVLAAAATRPGPAKVDEELGHGRLDMMNVLAEVKRRPCGHPGHDRA